MKIFKNTMMSTWDIGIVKIAVGCMALAIGATWPDIFAPYAKILFAVGVAAGLYALYVWLKK